ncbi:MAG: glycosyltransferase family 4 protein, partial [Muribaculaceae bacterium]|nr:glycosyltransferase family 4 protein [Muribaculaceae bacterium]
IERRKDGFPAVFRLVQVARLMPEKKGQDIAIRALAILKKRGIENVSLCFIGYGAGLEELRQLARTENVSDRIEFAGIRDRSYIYSHLCQYDAMIHPSRYEGFGLTVAEGMAAGLPLILTEHDGPWEVADHGRLCLSAEKGSPESFADAIEKLMNDYPAALTRAGEALEYVRRFDISRTIEAYDKLYLKNLS